MCCLMSLTDGKCIILCAASRRAQPCCFDTDSAVKTHLQGDSVLGSEDVSRKFAYIQGHVLFPVVRVWRKFSQAGLADIFNLVQSNGIAAEVPARGSTHGGLCWCNEEHCALRQVLCAVRQHRLWLDVALYPVLLQAAAVSSNTSSPLPVNALKEGVTSVA